MKALSKVPSIYVASTHYGSFQYQAPSVYILSNLTDLVGAELE